MKKILKSWGWEHWFANNEKYCGKVLYINYGKWSSEGRYHYHKIKDETFFIVEGMLRVDYYDIGINITKHSIILNEGDSFRVPTGMKHRFTAASKDGCNFIEASTTHFDSDSYRCELDDKGNWIE